MKLGKLTQLWNFGIPFTLYTKKFIILQNFWIKAEFPRWRIAAKKKKLHSYRMQFIIIQISVFKLSLRDFNCGSKVTIAHPVSLQCDSIRPLLLFLPKSRVSSSIRLQKWILSRSLRVEKTDRLIWELSNHRQSFKWYRTHIPAEFVIVNRNGSRSRTLNRSTTLHLKRP